MSRKPHNEDERDDADEEEKDDDEAEEVVDSDEDYYYSDQESSNGGKDTGDDDDDDDDDDEDEEDDDEDEGEDSHSQGQFETRKEIAEALKEMPLGERERLQKEGINGEPLHKHLGFSTPVQFSQWLAHYDDRGSISDEGKKEFNGDEDSEPEASPPEQPPAVMQSNSSNSASQSSNLYSENENLVSNSRDKDNIKDKGTSRDRDNSKDKDSEKKLSPEEKRRLKQRQKRAPKEQTSKKEVSRFNHQSSDLGLGNTGRKPRDPRFEELVAGKVKPAFFEDKYGFLEEGHEKEIKELQQELRDAKRARALAHSGAVTKSKRRRERKKMKSEAEVNEMQRRLTKLQQEKSNVDRERSARRIQEEHVASEYELVKSGKKQRPHFLARQELKQKELEARFEELDKKGKAEKFIARKRKKNATKDRKKLSKSSTPSSEVEAVPL